jgi:pimeloyl-ACP methyl ester carboxylesterase
MRAAATPLRPMPLAVLSRGQPFELPPDLPAGFSAEALEQAWLAAQADLPRLVPDARFSIAGQSGHNIHQEQPELVIEAIRQVVAGVRDPDTWYDLTSCCMP